MMKFLSALLFYAAARASSSDTTLTTKTMDGRAFDELPKFSLQDMVSQVSAAPTSTSDPSFMTTSTSVSPLSSVQAPAPVSSSSSSTTADPCKDYKPMSEAEYMSSRLAVLAEISDYDRYRAWLIGTEDVRDYSLYDKMVLDLNCYQPSANYRHDPRGYDRAELEKWNGGLGSGERRWRADHLYWLLRAEAYEEAYSHDPKALYRLYDSVIKECEAEMERMGEAKLANGQFSTLFPFEQLLSPSFMRRMSESANLGWDDRTRTFTWIRSWQDYVSLLEARLMTYLKANCDANNYKEWYRTFFEAAHSEFEKSIQVVSKRSEEKWHVSESLAGLGFNFDATMRFIALHILTPNQAADLIGIQLDKLYRSKDDDAQAVIKKAMFWFDLLGSLLKSLKADKKTSAWTYESAQNVVKRVLEPILPQIFEVIRGNAASIASSQRNPSIDPSWIDPLGPVWTDRLKSFNVDRLDFLETEYWPHRHVCESYRRSLIKEAVDAYKRTGEENLSQRGQPWMNHLVNFDKCIDLHDANFERVLSRKDLIEALSRWSNVLASSLDKSSSSSSSLSDRCEGYKPMTKIAYAQFRNQLVNDLSDYDKLKSWHMTKPLDFSPYEQLAQDMVCVKSLGANDPRHRDVIDILRHYASYQIYKGRQEIGQYDVHTLLEMEAYKDPNVILRIIDRVIKDCEAEMTRVHEANVTYSLLGLWRVEPVLPFDQLLSKTFVEPLVRVVYGVANPLGYDLRQLFDLPSVWSLQSVADYIKLLDVRLMMYLRSHCKAANFDQWTDFAKEAVSVYNESRQKLLKRVEFADRHLPSWNHLLSAKETNWLVARHVLSEEELVSVASSRLAQAFSDTSSGNNDRGEDWAAIFKARRGMNNAADRENLVRKVIYPILPQIFHTLRANIEHFSSPAAAGNSPSATELLGSFWSERLLVLSLSDDKQKSNRLFSHVFACYRRSLERSVMAAAHKVAPSQLSNLREPCMQDLVNLDRLTRVEQHSDHPFGFVRSRESLLEKVTNLSSTKCIVSSLGNKLEVRNIRYDIENELRQKNVNCMEKYFDLYLEQIYALQDDLCIPFLVTVDSQTGKNGTVIVRKGQRPEQVRVLAQEVPQVLLLLIHGHLSWDDVVKA